MRHVFYFFSLQLLNRYTDSMLDRLNDLGVIIGNFQFLRPSDYFYRDQTTDEVYELHY